MTKTQLNIPTESQEVTPFRAGDHKAAMNRRESITKHDINNTNDPQKKYRLGTVSKNILLEGLNRFHGANLTPIPDVDQSNKVAKIRNRYNQVPHLTQDTNGKVTNSQKTPQTRAKRSALSQQVTTKHI